MQFSVLTVNQASKAAIESFARTWNNEFGVRQGITINPGPVQCVRPPRILQTDIFYWFVPLITQD